MAARKQLREIGAVCVILFLTSGLAWVGLVGCDDRSTGGSSDLPLEMDSEEDSSDAAQTDVVSDLDADGDTRDDSDVVEDDPESDQGGADLDSDAEVGTNQLPPGIHALQGLQVDLPMDDLAPLAGIVGGAPVVALGESIHTSDGFYQAKHRIFRYLVTQLGFRAFAIESPWEDADQVADYVRTCQGDPSRAISEGLFGVWAGQRMLELVEWMCAWNTEHPDDPVHFFGFDIQQPWDDGPALMAFLTRVAGDQAEPFNQGILRCEGASFASAESYYQDPGAYLADPNDHEACWAALEAVEGYFDQHSEEIITTTSEEELAWARVYLVGLESWEQSIWLDNQEDWVGSYEARDHGMAQVFREIWRLRHPESRVAIWAHNWHIACLAHEMVGQLTGAKSMGTFLAEELGDDYLAIGLTGYDVWIDWFGDVERYRAYTGDDVVEWRLHQLETDYLLVDLAFPGGDPPFFANGELYWLGLSEQMVPAEQYRALIYLEYSPPMEYLDL
ncbi:MAG: erythromycin esterase family protein [Bradymonadales bacterium]|nr:erythromycin esterase family protein [Bradymonadales bacterium]